VSNYIKYIHNLLSKQAHLHNKKCIFRKLENNFFTIFFKRTNFKKKI